jgi:putative spermidine/putrescine transport system ATP-binding protein
MIELPHLGNRRPAQLSGGQQQRVALARALVFEPSVVLMDEPLGALDKRLRETMQYEIMRLHRELSLTIVYVTHDQAEALTMSDRVAVFSDGRIQQAASPAQLYEDAQNAFVANFVGENNGLRGRVVSVNDNRAMLALADGSVIHGRCEQGLREGDEAMLALRPERAHIPSAEGTAAGPHSNVVHARVQEQVYCGDHHRVHLKLASGDALVAKVPNTQRHALPVAGQSVEVAWNHDDCKILAAHAPRSAPARQPSVSPSPSILSTAPAGAN